MMMKMGPLSEVYIATNRSSNEVIGLHCMKTEGRTHMIIHTTHKPVSEAARLSFGKTSSCKAFAGMTFNSGNLTDILCLYIEHL